MNPLNAEGERYSLKTLKALHYGARHSGVSRRGTVHITYLNGRGEVHEGNVIAVGETGVETHTETGRILPSRILHAEVV